MRPAFPTELTASTSISMGFDSHTLVIWPWAHFSQGEEVLLYDGIWDTELPEMLTNRLNGLLARSRASGWCRAEAPDDGHAGI